MWFVAVLTVLTLTGSSLALKPVPVGPLTTPPTWWDQAGVGRNDGDRVIDERNGHIQCVSELKEGPYGSSPEQAARGFLQTHKDWVGVEPSEAKLQVTRVVESPMGYHVTLEQVVRGVPVYPGDVVVTLDRDLRVRFYFSSLFCVSEDIPTDPVLSAEQAVVISQAHLQPKSPPRDEPQTGLVIWAGDNRDFALCWRVRQFMENPMGDWEVLVDAKTGRIRRVADRACYIDGTGSTYQPDPLTTAEVNYGTTGYVDGNDANTAQLQAEIIIDTLRDITFSGGLYRLQGPYCQLLDFESPTSAPATATNPDSFRFNRQQQGFEDVETYYIITTSQRWIQSLGFTNIQNTAIVADPHGLNGDDNSHYIPSTNRLAFGEGGVDDAEDADVILHEYGHAITFGCVSNWGGGDEGSIGEGVGDYWAGSYSRSLSAFHHTWVYNWDGHNPFWPGRVLNAGYLYPRDNGDIYSGGQIWSQACYETLLDVGREVADRLSLQALQILGSGATMPAAARAWLTADDALYNEANHWSIFARFQPRGLLPVAPSFALLSPLGGDLWPIDSTVTVSWISGYLNGVAHIELSRNGGVDWEVLADSTANDGQESFVVSGPPSDDCRVRIRFAGTVTRSDSSDSNFVIGSASVVRFDTFDDSSADQWTHSSAGGNWGDQWHLSTERAHSGTQSYKCGDAAAGQYAARLDARLTSPVIPTLPEHSMLEFWHQIEAEVVSPYGVDSSNDGGILEISVNGGAFAQIYPDINGYNSRIRGATTPSGPFTRSTRVWSGLISNWQKVTVRLDAYAGDSIQFRFRFGSNSSVGREGWYVDDVKLYGPPFVATPTAVTLYYYQGALVLRWRSSGAPHYRVYSGSAWDGSDEVLEGTTDGNVFIIPGAPDSLRYFHVKGWDGN